MLHSILLQTHSILRWVVLILLLWAIVRSIISWTGNRPFTAADRKTAMFALISVHIQFVIGLILFFISPIVQTALNDMGAAMGNKGLRFFAVEHSSMMLIAAILITIGYSRAKRVQPAAGHKNIAIFYLLGLLLILAAIPWPFNWPDRGWF